MSPTNRPGDWTNPSYVATLVGVLATGAVVFYAARTDAGPTVDEVVFVLLTVTLPMTVAYEVARRL